MKNYIFQRQFPAGRGGIRVSEIYAIKDNRSLVKFAINSRIKRATWDKWSNERKKAERREKIESIELTFQINAYLDSQPSDETIFRYIFIPAHDRNIAASRAFSFRLKPTASRFHFIRRNALLEFHSLFVIDG